LLLYTGVLLFGNGCLEFHTQISLNSDGSGKIVVQGINAPKPTAARGSTSPFMQDVYEETTKAIASKFGYAVRPKVDEQDAIEFARKLGPQVRLLSFRNLLPQDVQGKDASALDTGSPQRAPAIDEDAEPIGFIATYQFKNIDLLRIGPKNIEQLLGSRETGLFDWRYGFQYTAGRKNEEVQAELNIEPPKRKQSPSTLVEILDGVENQPAFDIMFKQNLANARYILTLITPGTKKNPETNIYENDVTVLVDIHANQVLKRVGSAAMLHTRDAQNLLNWRRLQDEKIHFEHPVIPRRITLKLPETALISK